MPANAAQRLKYSMTNVFPLFKLFLCKMDSYDLIMQSDAVMVCMQQNIILHEALKFTLHLKTQYSDTYHTQKL